MDVGFERPGIKVVFANEVMKEAAQTYILISVPSMAWINLA